MSTYRRKRDVRFRIVGEEGVAVRQEAAEVVAVNDVGARILSLLETEHELEDLVKRLAAEYDVDPGELSRDIEGFVTELVEAGVVEASR